MTKIFKKNSPFFLGKSSQISLFFTVFSLLIWVLIFSNCQNQKTHSADLAFYHWKSQFALTDFEKAFLSQTHASKLYIRLFDVDFDAKTGFAQPIGVLQNPQKLKGLSQKIVPTVFLTNRVFQNLTLAKFDSLVGLILQKIAQNTEGVIFDEIQFDCDWTSSTRDRFFSFLEKIKTLTSKKLTATIRLHQIKYHAETGIPPVERGMLMAYNVGDLDKLDSENSILDIEVLKSYIADLDKYPLDLDVALPIFSWAVVFRDGELVKLLPNFPEKVPPQYLDILKQTNQPNRMEVVKNGYVEGIYLYQDDQIRLENTPLSILTQTAVLLRQKIQNQSLTVSFFSLDSTNLVRYQPLDLKKIGN